MKFWSWMCGVLGAVVLAANGCGTLGTEDGGASHLPNRGAGPYNPVEVETEEGASWFLAPPDPSRRYVEPTALVRDGNLELYVVEEVLIEGTVERKIVRLPLDADLHPGQPNVVLTGADLPDWTMAQLASPAIIQRGDSRLLSLEVGSRAGIVFFKEEGDGTFVLDDDIDAFLPVSEEEEEGGIGSPSILWRGDELVLLYTAYEAGGSTRIREARFVDGVWRQRRTVLEPGTSCLDTEGKDVTCWDQEGVLDGELRKAQTGAGEPLLRLFYAGHSGKKTSLGFAASYGDGQYKRTAINPVLGGTKKLSHPSNVLFSERYLLFYEEEVTGGRHGIGLAESPGGMPSERF